MAQSKKKASTKTAKKMTSNSCKKNCSRKKTLRYEKYQRGQKSNPFFIIMMSILAASLLFANLMMMI